MKRKTVQAEKDSYPSRPYRWLMAVSTAHFIVTYNQDKNTLLIMTQLNYWLAMAVSIVVAILMINAVTLTSKELDKLYNWEVFPLKRIVLQMLFGLLLPLIIDVLLIWAFFAFFGHDFWSSRFMKQELKLILVLLIALNMLYFAIYYKSALNRHKQEAAVKIPASLGKKKLAIAPEEIAYAYRQDHYGYIICKSGHSFHTDCSIEKLKTLLPATKFIQTRRHMIVSLDAIQSYEPYGNGQGKIFMRCATDNGFNEIITREFFPAFKQRMLALLATVD
ncbi:hypothetical protein BCY91_12680 [Pelobium manganitolerans]|uniref:HTH LytTR-type domain-containing protein n=1 Tax=Pelobium manganitolerans TaxID=1842495 RepID=A0A419S1Z1_9SPHI|nr:LytTR family DNA-binding domain-containing protein [Pelobium manganitolerans]RKD12493.1 hypothetical protein BCY91_12680 [Pelobium manganitolerans]